MKSIISIMLFAAMLAVFGCSEKKQEVLKAAPLNKAAAVKLLEAISQNDLKGVERALDAGADVHAKMKEGGTALMGVSVLGHSDVAKVLL